MKTLLHEALRTLHVGTYFPLGWGVRQLKRRIETSSPSRDSHLAPILLVHGAFHNSTAFFALSQKLHQCGFRQVHTLELMTSLNGIDALTEQLKIEVRRRVVSNPENSPDPRAQIVAHSLGGILLRRAMQDPGFVHHVSRCIFLGTPHQGLKRVPWSLPSIRALHTRSELLLSLRQDPLAPGVDYWNLRGALDVITPLASTFLPHIPNKIYPSVGHAGLLSSSEVLSDVVEILESPVYDPNRCPKEPPSILLPERVAQENPR